MYKTIVVPLDLVEPHPAASAVAEVLACRSGVGVRLVTVSFPGPDRAQDELELERMAKEMDAADVRVEAIESNNVVETLLDTTGADGLLCIETRARGPLAAIVLGSTTAEILRKASRPVVLVGPVARPDRSLGVLEVCIDGPDAADALVPVATAWSRQFGLIPRLLSVWVPGALHRFASAEAAEELLKQTATRLGDDLGVDVDWELVHATAAPAAIVTDADRHLAALVAVAVRPHPQLQRVLGSTAVAVARATSASVLAVPCPRPGSVRTP